MRVRAYLRQLQEREAALADALAALAGRHGNDPDVSPTCLVLASWSRHHADALAALVERPAPPGPPQLAPSQGPPAPDLDLLAELQHAWLAAQDVHLRWTVVGQIARALRDPRLVALAADLGRETDRQLAWLHTRIVDVAPEALIAPPA